MSLNVSYCVSNSAFTLSEGNKLPVRTHPKVAKNTKNGPVKETWINVIHRKKSLTNRGMLQRVGKNRDKPKDDYHISEMGMNADNK